MFVARLGFVAMLGSLSLMICGRWEYAIVMALIFLGIQMEVCCLAVLRFLPSNDHQ